MLKYKFLISFIFGCAASLGLAPYSFYFFTILALILSLFLLDTIKDYKKALYIGFFYGLGFHFCSLYWIAISFKVANFGGYFFGYIAIIFLCSFLSVFSAISFFLVKHLNKKDTLFNKSILIIFIFSVFDWIKANIFWGFPWTPISAIWANNEFTLLPFAHLGIRGYSLLTYVLIVCFCIFCSFLILIKF